MKQIIVSQSLNIYLQTLSLLRSLKLIQIQNSSALILPPESPGNLGDEALVTSAVNYLKDKGIQYIGLVSHKKGCHWRSLGSDTVDEIIEMEDYFTFGDRRLWQALFRAIPMFSKYERFYCLGADMMDGHYSDLATFIRLKLASVVSQMGIESSILGFSFNNNATPTSLKTFRELPAEVKIYARDPISQQRLVTQINHPVQLVADVAFLLSPTPTTEIASGVLQWIDEQKASNRMVIGFAPYTQLNKNLGKYKVDKLIQIYADYITELDAKYENLSFILLSHDFRDLPNKPSDIVINEEILNILPPKIKSRSIKVPTPCTAAEIKAIVGNIDFVISGKFHLTIACLGQATPVAGITYQDKFEGLFKLFEIEGLTIAPEQVFQSGNLVNFLLPLIEKREEIHQKITSKLSKIQQLAQVNFELIK